MSNVRSLRLDVHAETISVAEVNGGVRQLGIVPSRPESVRGLVGELSRPERLRFCQEVGSTGYVLYRQLGELGVACEVIAPALVPMKRRNGVQTDRYDAAKRAKYCRAGDLTVVTAVWVTDYAYQALRGRVRARLAARRNQLRAGIRLSKFLLRHGRRRPEQIGAWTLEHLEWVRSKVRFEEGAKNATLLDYLHEVEHMATRFTRLEQAIDAALPVLPQTMRMVIDALQSLRNVAGVSPVTLVAELGQLSRFVHPRQLMGYSGVVSREHSSGERIRRDIISKTADTHLRRIVVEAAWSYRYRPAVGCEPLGFIGVVSVEIEGASRTSRPHAA